MYQLVFAAPELLASWCDVDLGIDLGNRNDQARAVERIPDDGVNRRSESSYML